MNENLLIGKRFHALIFDKVNKGSQKISKNNTNHAVFLLGLELSYWRVFMSQLR